MKWRDLTVQVDPKLRKTTVWLTVTLDPTRSTLSERVTGFSICRPEDTWNTRLGITVALINALRCSTAVMLLLEVDKMVAELYIRKPGADAEVAQLFERLKMQEKPLLKAGALIELYNVPLQVLDPHCVRVTLGDLPIAGHFWAIGSLGVPLQFTTKGLVIKQQGLGVDAYIT